MSQTYSPPAGSVVMATAVKTDLVNCLAALRSLFSGTIDPSAVAYQLFAKTDTAQLKMRDASNSAFVTVAKLLIDWCKRITWFAHGASLAATETWFAHVAVEACKIKRIIILSSVSSSSSSGNEWQFACTNRNTGNQLFSGTVGTFTALGGVGGGAEILNTAQYSLTPNQNDSLAKNDVLEFTMTKVGSATTLTRFAIAVEYSESE